MSPAGTCPTQRALRAGALPAALLAALALLAFASTAAAKVSGPEVDVYAESFGVPEAVAEERLEIQSKGAKANIAGTLEDQLGARYAGVWFDNEAGEFVVPTASASARGAVASELGRASLARDYRSPVVGYSWEQLRAAQRQLDGMLREFFEEDLVQTALDPKTNAVAVNIASSATQEDRAGIISTAKRTPARVVVRDSEVQLFAATLNACSPNYHNCSRPLRGGVEIGTFYDGYGRCTAGFRAIGNTNHNRYLLTAGHCAGKGHPANPTIHWYAWDEQNKPGQAHGERHYLGPIEGYAFPAHDWMKINISGGWWDTQPWPSMVGYWTSIFEGFGPVEDFEEIPITGEAASYPGLTLCHTGFASGGSCGEVLETEVSESHQDGLTHNLVKVKGGCSIGGDSGGPWFASNTAYGMHFGDIENEGGCEGFKYYTELTKATAALDVHIYKPVEAQTGGLSGFSPKQATVTGTVAPEGNTTNYHFQFGTTAAYGSASQLYGAGSGWATVPANGTLNNLKGNTTYHYRLVAQNAEGTAYGQDQTFTTPDWRPQITPQAPTEIKAGHGNLNALVNPQGSATSYRFEWGKASEGFPNKVPVPDGNVGSGTSNVAVSEEITGLKGLTEYHWRVVASNEDGTTESATQTSTTPDWRPAVTNEKQTGVKVVEEAGQATLHGKVNPKGFDTDYRFEWGTQEEFEAGEYNNSAPVPDGEAGSGEADVQVSATMRPLKGETTYHYRLVAENVEGKSPNLEDRSFTTPNWRPWVSHAAAVGVGAEDATLIARVQPKGFTTSYRFEWGTQAEYEEGELNNTIEGGELAPAEQVVEVEEPLSGLQPRKAYRFRVIAENAEGSSEPTGAPFKTSTAGFVASSYPKTLVGTPQGPFFESFFGVPYECTSPALEAKLEQTGPEFFEAGAEILSTTSVGGIACSGSIGNHEWDMADCRFEFDPGYGDRSGAEGEFNIGPPGCGPITTDLGYCPISIHPQIGRSATYQNKESGEGEVVEVDISIGDLRYSSPGGVGCGAVTNAADGGLSATWVLAPKYSGDTHVTPAFEVGPEVTTGASSDVDLTSATVHGSIDTLGYKTFWGFEYGPSPESYESLAYGGEISSEAEGQQGKELTIDGLKPGQTYHYRVYGLNENGLSVGEDATFTTAPAAITAEPTGIGVDSATLNGSVNPAGLPTTYQLEYDTSEYGEGEEGHGTSVPASPESIGSGTGYVEVSEPLEGLESGTTYHYRVVATNEEGTFYGDDVSFQTGVPRFHAGSYPAQVEGEAEGLSAVFGGENAALSCETASFEGELGGPAAQLALDAEYNEGGKCDFLFGKATANMGSCHYLLDPGSSGPPYSGGIGVACAEEGDAIMFYALGCVFKLPAQEPVDGLSYENKGEGPGQTIELSGTAEGLTYTASPACGFLGVPLSGEDATLTLGSPATLGATSEGEGTGLFVTQGGALPYGQTDPATSVEVESATLNATLNPAGLPTTYQLEYDTSEYGEGEEGHGTSVPASPESIGSGTGYVEVSEPLEGLEAGTTYHYRVVATNEEGAFYGKDVSFQTGVPRFHAGSYPAQVEGEAEGLSAVFGSEEATLSCETASFEGELGGATAQLALDAEYNEGGKCDFTIGATTVNMGSCRYLLDLGTSGPPYSGGVGVACTEEGDSIEFARLGCLVEIPAQEPVDGLSYENKGEGAGQTIELSGTAEGLAYTASSICGLIGIPESGEDATLTLGSPATLGATSEGEGVGLFVGSG